MHYNAFYSMFLMICPSLHREGDEWADGWTLWLLPRDPANGGGREESHEVQSKVWISTIRFSCKQNCKTLFFKVQIFFAGLNVITFYVTHLRQGLIPFISIFLKFARFVYVTQFLILELITKDRHQKQMDSRVLRVRVTWCLITKGSR